MNDNKQDVRGFLTSRRAKVTPERAGLGRDETERRVPGLRREEVAQLAGVSCEYYTRLEKGNLAGVSETVLHSIATALLLDEAEREYLFNLASSAGRVRIPHQRKVPRFTIRPSVQRMLDGMTDMVAFVTNGRMDLLAHNKMARALYSPMFASRVGPGNFARFNFLEPAARTLYPRWDQAADVTVSLLRTEAGKRPHDYALIELVEELCEHSEEFSRRWASYDVRLHRAGRKTFLHPHVGKLTLDSNVVGFFAEEGITMMVYSADPQGGSADGMRRLSAMAIALDSHSGPAVPVGADGAGQSLDYNRHITRCSECT